LIAVFAIATACDGADESEPEPTADEIRAYYDDVQAVLARASARFDLLVRIFDDETYIEGLTLNSRRFSQGAKDLSAITAPPRFSEEHEDYMAALDLVAAQLADERERIDDGVDVAEVIVSAIEGSLADAFEQLAEACTAIARQADDLGFYDELGCGADPYFIEGAEPPWAQRVFVNTCCGGSHPLSNPLDIFYGSDEPWERTREHYEEEMKERGFESRTRGERITFSKPERPEECFSVEPYREEDLSPPVEVSDVAELERYPHAYVTGYTRLCDG
jgi:hypothetical protein